MTTFSGTERELSVAGTHEETTKSGLEMTVLTDVDDKEYVAFGRTREFLRGMELPPGTRLRVRTEPPKFGNRPKITFVEQSAGVVKPSTPTVVNDTTEKRGVDWDKRSREIVTQTMFKVAGGVHGVAGEGSDPTATARSISALATALIAEFHKIVDGGVPYPTVVTPTVVPPPEDTGGDEVAPDEEDLENLQKAATTQLKELGIKNGLDATPVKAYLAPWRSEGYVERLLDLSSKLYGVLAGRVRFKATATTLTFEPIGEFVGS